MPRRKRRSRARRYVRRFTRGIRRRVPKRISILTALPLVHKAGLEPVLGDQVRWGAKKMYEQTNGDIMATLLEAGNILMMNYTGFSIKGSDAGTFYPQYPMMTYGEQILGIAGHKVASKFGVNRQIHKLPFVGKKIEL